MPLAVTTQLSIHRTIEDGATVFRLAGDLDLQTARLLETAIAQEIVESAPGRLVLDMSELVFIDSTGLNVLVRGHRAMHTMSGTLVLRSPNQTTKLLLEITQLGGHLEIE